MVLDNPVCGFRTEEKMLMHLKWTCLKNFFLFILIQSFIVGSAVLASLWN